MKCILAAATILSWFFFISPAVKADSFGSGANAFDIDFVTVGNPGNTADATGNPTSAGAVGYSYRIGKYEISNQMIDKANSEADLGITRDTSGLSTGTDEPATLIDWFEAARFVNWLNTSKGYQPAYKFTVGFQLWTPSDPGYDPANQFRNTQTHYFLPSLDEWYKAAYYDPSSGDYYNYPTGSDVAPTAVNSGTASGTAVYNQGFPFPAGPANITQAGGLSPYGTVAQGGNANEWLETELDSFNDSKSANRRVRGGDSSSIAFNLSVSSSGAGDPGGATGLLGFRVASVVENVPEPSTLVLALFAGLGILSRRIRS